MIGSDCFSQSPGKITVKVSDENGSAVENVLVVLFNSSTSLQAVTGKNGTHRFNDLPAANYKLTFSKEDHSPVNLDLALSSSDTVLNVTMIVQTSDIIVTAARHEQKLENSTIPVSLISEKEIQNSGYSRLSDVLEDQPGINLTNFLGIGVQLQGLDPDYTLILIDGEPLTGRNGGTLDLSRISTGNIKQVEIIRGPSSSLYGSEALAGVINIITHDYIGKLQTNVSAKYGSFDRTDLNAGVSLNKDNFGFDLFLNRFSSSGYDLTPNTLTQTSPGFYNYTANPSFEYRFDNTTSLKLSGRAYIERQSFLTIVRENGADVDLDDNESLNDYSLNLSFDKKLSSSVNLNSTVYASAYEYNSILTYKADGSSYFEDKFKQKYYKGEAVVRALLPYQNLLSIGAGAILENVNADRIYGGERNTSNYFGFLQNEWMPVEKLIVVAGTRFDSHSDYSSRISPKLSLLYKPFGWISLRSSVGAGFKAPTFQQLYLDFFNPLVGYSVFGTFGFHESFQRVLAAGEIQEIFIDPSTIQIIKPENSVAYNFGFNLSLFKNISAEINLFRNDVNDLIEVLPVARKTNGQSVFTYFNLNRIYTQGFDSKLSISLPLNLSFVIGYQYLQAKDKDVVDKIKAGKIFKVGATGVTRPVYMVEYGGLFDRPRHSGNIKLSYSNDAIGFNANLRTIIKGRYGYADKNSNQILDNDNEYIPGYVLWSFTLSKKIASSFTARFGIDNVFNRTDAALTPEQPGRVIFGEISFSY